MGGTFSLTPAAVAAFALFIGTLIFVHELGHFLAAKFFGIKVLKFSLGFGRPIIKFTRGETDYQISWLPLGGFVKMLGDQPGDEIPHRDRHRAFDAVPVHHRAIVALAGPVFNLVFPVICFFAYYLLEPTVFSPVVGQVESGTPAEKAGFQEGDRILAVDGARVWDFERFASLVSKRPGESLHIEIDRDGAKKTIEVVPRAVTETDHFGKPQTSGRIGIGRSRIGTRVGVDRPLGTELGFQTGDQILSIDDARPEDLASVGFEIRHRQGRTARFMISRSKPLLGGDILAAQDEDIVSLEVQIPAGATGLESLGLAASDTFLRALEPDGAAYQAGLRPGDRIVSIDGVRVNMIYSVLSAIYEARDKPVRLGVRRAGQDFEVTLVSKAMQVTNEMTGKSQPYYDSGLGLGEIPRAQRTIYWSAGGRFRTEVVELSIVEAFGESVRQTAAVIVGIVDAVYRLLSLQISAKNVGGPIMLFQVAAQAAEEGLLTYLQHLAMISVNLGIVNLLPIPIFDGGHLMFCLIEAIKRRPVSPRAREVATLAGLAFIAMLIILVFVNDVGRISGALE